MATSFYNEREVHSQVNRQKIRGNVNHYTTYNLLDKRQQIACSDADPEKSLDDAILASLAFSQMTDRRRAVDLPHHKTCQWIFELKEYQDWKTQSSGILWIKGKPGAGKSTLMSHLYSAICAERFANEDDTIYLEFFFSAYGVPLQRSPLGMLRALLNQNFHHDPAVRSLLRASYMDKQTSFGNRENSWEWQQPELETLLIDMVLLTARRQQVVIFIDALDEAGEHMAREIAQYFHRLNDRSREQSTQVKICISCRHYPVPSNFQAAVEVHVEVHNHKDIKSCIQDRLRYMIGDGEEWQALINSLTRMANGVFQWVRLVMPLVEKRISDGDSADQVQQWLPLSLTGLEEVYEYIFKQVLAQEYRTKSLRLFQWVCLAIRPLSVTELRYALAAHDMVANPLPQSTFHESPDYVNSDNTMELRIRSWSGGLIEVLNDENAASIVQPIHLSVNNFIMKNGFHFLAQTDLTFDKRTEITDLVETYHGELYWACLRYFAVERARLSLLIDITAKRRWKGRIDKIRAEFPFVVYADSNILVHAEKARAHRTRSLDLEVKLLEYVIPIWVRFAEVFCRYTDYRFNDGTTPLHIAAAANLQDLVLYLLAHEFDVSVTDVDQRTALHVASKYGHLAIVETLVRAGACPQASTIERDTPATLAAGRGHVDVFSWLLQHAASDDAAADGLKAAVYVAALKGHATIIKLCLEAGVDINAQGGEYGSTLQAASRNGNEKVVQLLLKAGADVNAQGGYYGNALQAASGYDKEEAVILLLEAGADVNTQGGYHGSALQAASTNGNEKAVQLLLEAGADVHAQGKHHGNALQAASRNGNEKAVQLLLEAGADVNDQGGYYGNALQAASRNGNEKAVQLLLEAGADVNAQGGKYGTALQAASWYGNEKAVQLLLEAGADVNAQGGKYGTALQAAAATRYGDEKAKKAVQLLLEAGADVNAQGGYHGSALQAASYHRHKKVTQMLKRAGAKVEANEDSDQSPT